MERLDVVHLHRDRSALATVDLSNGAGNNKWAYNAVATDCNFNSNVASFNLATMGGSRTFQASRTHLLDQIQALP
jgi:hypothetical protein